jgi:hypothetical protein
MKRYTHAGGHFPFICTENMFHAPSGLTPAGERIYLEVVGRFNEYFEDEDYHGQEVRNVFNFGQECTLDELEKIFSHVNRLFSTFAGCHLYWQALEGRWCLAVVASKLSIQQMERRRIAREPRQLITSCRFLFLQKPSHRIHYLFTILWRKPFNFCIPFEPRHLSLCILPDLGRQPFDEFLACQFIFQKIS